MNKQELDEFCFLYGLENKVDEEQKPMHVAMAEQKKEVKNGNII